MMYSQKVMEHFKHPHNLREIKNADGIGKVGNPVCLIPLTKIHINNNLKEIEKIDLNDKVLSHDGKYNKIIKRYKRDYSGKIIEIKNKLGKTVLTPEHEVLSVKVPKTDHFARFKNKRRLKYDWNHAEELEKNDLIVYPVLKEEKDLEFIESPQLKKKFDFRSKNIPEKIKINEDFLRLAGYYLAEGSLKDKVTKTHLSFTFNINEEDLAQDVMDIAKRLFGVNSFKKIKKERNTLIVTINNVFVVRLFKSLFGFGAENKKIPDWMMLLPIEKQKSLIYGLWKGDGYFNENKRAGYSTISYVLCQQLKILLLRQNIVPSIYTEEEKITKGIKHKKAYKIHVGDRSSLEKLAKILNIKLKIDKPVAVDSWFDDNFLFIPISKIEKKDYSGFVYNLEVENSMSYATESLAVHNCGDLMWVYIKVEKNKEGKEYIKDIGVKTFGCLPPEEKVVVSEGGWKNISSMKIGEQVVNDLGRETNISKTFEINYNGPMLKILPFVSPFNSFSVTPEHPILCIKREWFKTREQKPNSKWLRILNKSFLSKDPEFLAAKNLKTGDYLVFSFNQKIEDKGFFTKDWLRFIGYYLAEGYITAKNSVVNFSFNKNEQKPINEVKKLIYKFTDKHGSQRTRKNVTEVYVCSRKLVRLLNSFAWKFAREKKLSEEIMLLPPRKQIEIINTFYIGDGDKTIRRKGNSPTFRLATASQNLAIQLQEILARNNIFASIVKRTRKKHFIEGREVTGKELYIVSFKKEREHKFVHKVRNKFLIPIKKIEKKHYNGLVYNLDVDKEPNSYLVKGFAVHNCVAAIATSSMITELAKGKTIEEAKKITRDEVKDALEGLPPIKVHCSNLSAEGLHKAIEDYENKKANKK